MFKLILIRGLPGSGKSTMAKNIKKAEHIEADMFFYKDGIYSFDPTKIKEAHEWCQQATKEALLSSKTVVVSNTFTKIWEMQPYLDMAAELKIPVEVITTTGAWDNIHAVPAAVITAMKERWEEYP